MLCIETLIYAKRNVSHRFLKDEKFILIRHAIDNLLKERQKTGLGFNPKKSDIVTDMMEEELWREGILGVNSPRHLLRTLVFVLGLNLGLRSGEHRKLRQSMFKVST